MSLAQRTGPALVKKGNKVLLQRCSQVITQFPVTDEVLDTIDLCKESLREADGFWKGRGMSVASTQVGKPDVPLFLMCSRENWYTPKQYRTFQTFVNPRIVSYSENLCLSWEGCISSDDEMVLMERPVQVKAAWQDVKGNPFDLVLTGLMSRIFQHEIDHLNGLVMWDDSVPQDLIDSQPEGSKVTPRRIDRMQDLGELASLEAQEKFYQANRRYIFEY